MNRPTHKVVVPIKNDFIAQYLAKWPGSVKDILVDGANITTTDDDTAQTVLVFKNRLFFLEKDSASLWYGDLDAITGPLSKVDLSLVNPEGGNCLAIGSITLDTGRARRAPLELRRLLPIHGASVD